MAEKVLITGGAGFIGSHLADQLLRDGHRVSVLDALVEQVHEGRGRPDYLSPEVELIEGDIRDAGAVDEAVRDVDAVVHLASAVGVGQSMYQLRHYTDVNNLGTANLLEALVRRPVGALVVASSMSVYGEGLYRRPDGAEVHTATRSPERLKAGRWEVDDADGTALEPVATPETKRLAPSSVYALSKYDQERLCLMIGQAYGIPTVALRFFNVYGPRQALSNPYTGVLAIFSARLLNGRRPLLFEDGEQTRDFVHVGDIARACRLALARPAAAGAVFNIGSGQAYTIGNIAERIARLFGRPDLTPEITGQYRVGDIRHCFADISRAREVLGYQPRVELDQGLAELAQWLDGRIALDRIEVAGDELARRGLRI